MSSSIWTRCAGDSELRALHLSPWRAVEAQHQVSTRKLVGSLAEQELLEDLLERSKPPAAGGPALHYLLATPFRYPPLRHGSRFGTRQERGIWYGAETRRTAFAEVAYYRFVFLAGTAADLGTLGAELTLFTVHARSSRGVDLLGAPFDAHRDAIASPASYADSQALGAAMRAAGVELFRYPSARDAEGGAAVGAFTPAVFGRAKPRGIEGWRCTVSAAAAEFAKRDYFARESYAFTREQFLVEGVLPAPAV